MIRMKKEIKLVESVDAIVCNICCNDIEPVDMCLRPEHSLIKAKWGYGSNWFGDGEAHEAHVCEECYKERIMPLFQLSPIKSFPLMNMYHILAPDEDRDYE